MYKVLVADDEPSVVDSLKISIDWESLGLYVAWVASNGKDALEILKNKNVDIVILDIRMAGFNGLELCQKIVDMKLETQIIIISGYAEFSYAEKAIQYGVLGYCLKPLEYEKITKLLVRAENKLSKKKDSQLVEILESIERNDIDVMKEKLRLINFCSEYVFLVVSVGEEKILFLDTNYIVIELGREQFLYICKNNPKYSISEESLLNKNIYGIGITDEEISLEELPKSLNFCITKAFQYFINEEEKICYKINTTKPARHIEDIRRCLVQNNWENIIDKLKVFKEESYKDFNIRAALKLCNMIHSGSYFFEKEDDYYVYSLRQLTYEYTDIKDLFYKLGEDIEKAFAQNKFETYTNTAFMELVTYIENNYRDNISLSTVAENCHMSPNYVSQLFKKESGFNFVQYITQLRMEEALKLIETSKKTIAEISSYVGYNDYFYFLKIFKKYTGKTLSQYREELS
ncbi:MAG: response regulator [Lachnospirales bacterium]